MIDPDHVTNFARTQAELEEFLCFAVLAANRDARLAARVLEALLDGCPCTSGLPPLTKIARTFEGPDGHTRLAARLAALGMGLYSLKAASLLALARIGPPRAQQRHHRGPGAVQGHRTQNCPVLHPPQPAQRRSGGT